MVKYIKNMTVLWCIGFIWNYLKLIIFKSIYIKLQIDCIFISKFENEILRINPKNMHMLMCIFNETDVCSYDHLV